jgi:queuine/archaeosine tRNA-ribosyltransferase
MSLKLYFIFIRYEVPRLFPTTMTIFTTAKTPFHVSYSRQGAIPHLVNPPCNTRLIALEQFIDLNLSGFPSFKDFIHTNQPIITVNQDLLRLYSNQFVKGNVRGIGLMKNPGQQVIVTPLVQTEILKNLSPNVAILSDPPIELYLEAQNQPFTKRSSNQERKAHERWFKWLENVINNTTTPIIACASGTQPSTIEQTTRQLVSSFSEKVLGYGMILPTPCYLANEKHSEEFCMQFRHSWKEKLDAFINSVDKIKLLALLGINSFTFLLEAIECGVTLFDNSMVDLVTDKGVALFVDLNELKLGDGEYSKTRNEAFFDLNKLNGEILNSQWQTDTRPLSETCKCWTCQNHHRAYIHHLLCVNDMLARILLKEHNQFQFSKFFDDVRESISDGTFNQKKLLYIGLESPLVD